MMTAEIIYNYFPKNELSIQQQEQFEQLFVLYKEWNEKINVISRKDIENFYIHHVLHSLAIAKLIQFKPNTEILDLGTGGGFPGIPLAILFPETQFLLVDSIQKKLKVVEAVAKALDLKNVTIQHSRAEELNVKVDFVVSRAVARVGLLEHWSKKYIKKTGFNTLKNGFILLKGGALDEELLESRLKFRSTPISNYFEEDFFEEKKIIYLYE